MLTKVCAEAELVIVMTETAQRLLVELRRLPGREDARRAARRPERDSRRRAMQDRSAGRATAASVLSTFGLISPGKGLETAIEALPAMLERQPEI